MAYNVLAIRRFGQVIGQCEALTPAQTVAEQNRAEDEARTRFCVARAAEGGEAYSVCYMPLCRTPLFILIIIFIQYPRLD